MKQLNIIQQILSKVAEEAQQEDENRPHTLGVYRASEIGGCPRAIQYSRLGYKPEIIGPETQLLFQDGHLHHHAVRELLAKVGTLSSIERTISKKYKHSGERFIITGTIDGIYNGVPFDVKSINTFRFKYIDRDFPDDYLNYVYQLMIYMDILDKEEGFFIFKDKNTSELKIKIIKYSKLTMDRILQQIAVIQKGIKDTDLIDRPYPMKDWHCRLCQHRLTCWNLPMEGKTWGWVKQNAQEGAKDASGSSLEGTLGESIKQAKKARLKRS